jgi:hypothetical protein
MLLEQKTKYGFTTSFSRKFKINNKERNEHLYKCEALLWSPVLQEEATLQLTVPSCNSNTVKRVIRNVGGIIKHKH